MEKLRSQQGSNQKNGNCKKPGPLLGLEEQKEKVLYQRSEATLPGGKTRTKSKLSK